MTPTQTPDGGPDPGVWGSRNPGTGAPRGEDVCPVRNEGVVSPVSPRRPSAEEEWVETQEPRAPGVEPCVTRGVLKSHHVPPLSYRVVGGHSPRSSRTPTPLTEQRSSHRTRSWCRPVSSRPSRPDRALSEQSVDPCVKTRFS